MEFAENVLISVTRFRRTAVFRFAFSRSDLVSPSQLNQTQQPIDASTFPRPTLALRSRSLSDTPGLVPELPTQFEQSCLRVRLPLR